MSSFIGHSVAAATVFIATESSFSRSPRTQIFKSLLNRDRWWLCWLVIIASIPDLDYIVESWHLSNNQGLRITHSLAFSLIVPCCTIAILVVMGIRGKIWLRSLQAILAGLSHLILDLAVGVTPLPLLFPVNKNLIKLPWGILPSAGKIALDNYYFYRNLLLEIGVLLPILVIVCFINLKSLFASGDRLYQFLAISVLVISLLCLSHSIQQNLQLPR